MIGNIDLDTYSTDEEKWEASKANFKEAMDAARREYEEIMPNIGAKEPYYGVIDLDEARTYIPSINYGSVQTDSKGRIEWTK